MNDIKSPPNNQRAERAVLGSMLISRAAAELALRRLEPADFYQEELKAIFQAILDLRSEFPDSPVDLVTVGSKIRNIQLLTECEHDVGTAHHIEYYVKLVRDLNMIRIIL